MRKIFKSKILILIILLGLSAQIAFAYSITPFGITDAIPGGITIDGAGNIYTANYNGANNVSKITPAGVSTILGTTGAEPTGIITDGAGNIYTANYSANNVSKITPAGVSTILGTTGTNPYSITIDGDGNIYTANIGSDNVTKITPAGVSTILGTTGAGPYGITIDGAGNIYTSNYSANNVSKITPAGVSTILGTTGNGPWGITIDGAGNIYTSNYEANNVSKITPAGVSTILGTTGTEPQEITIDGAGNIYTANSGSNNVSKITNPTITEVTPVTTPIVTDSLLDYTFNSNSDGSISVGGSCGSITTSAIAGDNAITFDALPAGTYSNCTIIVTDSFGPSNTLAVSSFVVSTTPTVTSSPATNITRVGATLNGEITATGGADATARGFQYGMTNSYGTTVTESSGPYSTGVFTADLSNLLTCGQPYYFRAYATNIAGTSYGAETTFTTTTCDTGGGGGGTVTPPPVIPPVTPPVVPPVTPPVVPPPTTINTICNLGDNFSATTGLPCTSYYQTNPTSSCPITVTLRFGYRGNQVKCLQIGLNISADGIFGLQTKAAVIKFQKSKGLVPDGIFGPKSRALWLK